MTKYSLIPNYNKSLTETQTWTRTLKNGKLVTLKVSNTYRCFKIEIELDDVEKVEILNMDTILLDKYSFIPDEMEGCDCWHEIIDMENFTEEEREEIDEDNIDIDLEFIEFKKWAKTERSRDRYENLDDTIETELKEQVSEQIDNKIKK